MGMYTEIYVNVDLKKETPEEVIQVLKAMCGFLPNKEVGEILNPYPGRWAYLFYSGSYYTPNTHCRFLEFDSITEKWSLLGKGDIKNYEQEIEAFFEWIMPWVDAYPGEFVGYSRYEEEEKPTLYFKPCIDENDGV